MRCALAGLHSACGATVSRSRHPTRKNSYHSKPHDIGISTRLPTRGRWAPLCRAEPGLGARGAADDDEAGLRSAIEAVKAAQSAGPTATHPLADTERIVATAMMAAITAVIYTLASVARLDSYASYFLPLPTVLVALRHGHTAALRAVLVSVLLLLVLTGPLRAATFLCMHGAMAVALGVAWAARLPWALSIPLAAAARCTGYAAYVALSSWATGEDLVALLLANVRALLGQAAVLLRAHGAPSDAAVAAAILGLLAVNAAVYVALLHLLYAVMLGAMGQPPPGRVPAWAGRLAQRVA
ncbi:hypothetical protein ACKKBF_B34640 [Auxenochlorella protothecoides x Auxenochlorella symbiontica]